MRRNPGDEEWRRLEREWAATGDPTLEAAYMAAWQRAGAPGRDPRRDPLPGDIVDARTEGRYSGRTGWSEVRRYEVVDVLTTPCNARVMRIEYGWYDGQSTWREVMDGWFVRRRLLGVVQSDGTARTGSGLPGTADPAPWEDEVQLASWRAWARSGDVVRRVPGEPVTQRRGRRQNPGDEGRRGRERRAHGYGGLEAEVARLTDAMRSGKIDPRRVAWAAALGDLAARTVVPPDATGVWRSGMPIPDPRVRGDDWVDPAVVRRPDQLTGIAWRIENEWPGPEHPAQVLFEWANRSVSRIERASGYVGGPSHDYRTDSPAWHTANALDQIDRGHFASACSDARLAAARAAEEQQRITYPLDYSGDEDAGTAAWSAELDAQFNDLIALLLGRPL